MKISVKGKNDVLSKKHIRYIVKLFGKLILNPQLYPNINLLVQNMNLSVNTWGYCGISDIEEKRPRSFEILLNTNISKNKQIKTLAHEMVHIKQYVYGETNEYGTRWRGQRINTENMDYYDEPWEIEAYGLSTGLFTKFAIKEKLWEVFSDVRNPDDILKPEPIAWRSIPQITIDNRPI